MNKAVCLIVLVLLMPLGSWSDASQLDQEIRIGNSYCPVSPDEPIDPDISVVHEGQRIFFCCNRCRKKFLQDPAAYVGALSQPVTSQEAAADHAHADPASEHGHHDDGESESGEHDHALDHGESEGLTKLPAFVGKFHPLVVHFPIALIMTALLAEGLSMWKKQPGFGEVARFALTLGAAGAIAAAGLGWLAAAGAHYPADLTKTLFLHRWVGVSVATVSTVAAVFSHLQKRGPSVRNAYLLCLLISALLVGGAGHLGATLIYGTDYFAW